MQVQQTEIPGVLIVEPKVFGDARGFFVETYQVERYAAAGLPGRFVQDNLSRSARGTLRGLHLQHPRAQGKLAWVADGEVLDVALDVRVGSPTFGRSVTTTLSSRTFRQFYLPPGFAHAFCVMSETALFAYTCTELYQPDHEIGVAWDDPDLGIEWPTRTPILSARDRSHRRLRDIPPDELPHYE